MNVSREDDKLRLIQLAVRTRVILQWRLFKIFGVPAIDNHDAEGWGNVSKSKVMRIPA